eukprot:Phypoly_transcript_05362.p1 GENE.Phypoly_transcript_05362~~Phypoly_transcript_05362.p1  ORF type:complete len:627 (+),score=83.49 Phypoly_transcript_05362:27-1883(+)
MASWDNTKENAHTSHTPSDTTDPNPNEAGIRTNKGTNTASTPITSSTSTINNMNTPLIDTQTHTNNTTIQNDTLPASSSASLLENDNGNEPSMESSSAPPQSSTLQENKGASAPFQSTNITPQSTKIAPQSISNNGDSDFVPQFQSGKVLTKHSRLVILTLKENSLEWQEKVPCSILLSTIIGVTTINKFFTIHFIAQEKKRKVKETVTFKCENESVPMQWADSVHKALNQNGKGTHGCRVVFVVNPFSGTRKALSVLASVRHLFDIAGMHVTVIETNAAGHAREIGRTIDISTVDRLVTVSGDGLFNELINGIMDRADWHEVTNKIPLGIIPAGSGNGLAAALGGATPTEAAFAVIKGPARPFDVLRTTQNGVSLYGFLTLTWAMISDVDIESEKMRWMGSLRFSIGALKRIMSLRKYKGKITYLPAEALHPHTPCVSYQDCNNCNSLPTISPPPAGPPLHTGTEAGANPHSSNDRVDELQSCLFDPNLPTPEGWQVLDDEFVLFIATNVSHISTDFIASPHAHLSDGAIDLILVRAKPDLTKAKLISLLLQTENGKYIHSPHVEHYKIKALYLEPGRVVDGHKEDVGVIAVDGEKVPYAPIGVEVFRGLFNILGYP